MQHCRKYVSQRGFTLLELMVAFVVFAVTFAVVIELATNAVRQSKHSAIYTKVALLAQSKLDAVGVGEPLEEGSESGEFDPGFRWALEIQKQEPPLGLNGSNEIVPIDLYRVNLQVFWDEWGTTHQASFTTLRTLLPNGT